MRTFRAPELLIHAVASALLILGMTECRTRDDPRFYSETWTVADGPVYFHSIPNSPEIARQAHQGSMQLLTSGPSVPLFSGLESKDLAEATELFSSPKPYASLTGRWLHLRDSNGDTGWIFSAYLRPSEYYKPFLLRWKARRCCVYLCRRNHSATTCSQDCDSEKSDLAHGWTPMWSYEIDYHKDLKLAGIPPDCSVRFGGY